jgi:hypothetical protein
VAVENGIELRAGEPFEMVVEPGKVREFAAAVLAAPDDPLPPPTFLASHLLWWAPENRPVPAGVLDRTRLLHGEQEFVFHGPPPRVGDHLTVVARIDKVYEKEGGRGGTMRFVEWVTEFRDEQGELVAELRATMIETGQPAGR